LPAASPARDPHALVRQRPMAAGLLRPRTHGGPGQHRDDVQDPAPCPRSPPSPRATSSPGDASFAGVACV